MRLADWIERERYLVATALMIGLALPALAQTPERKVTAGGSCLACHLQLDEARLHDPAAAFAEDVHNRPGLGCVTCHGGNPKAEDPEEAMDPKKGFRGAPKIFDIPKLCGGCHANDAFIKKFSPSLDTDQLAQYRTSVHGQRIASGDTRAATCISCHGVHNILKVSDPRAPVFPTHVVDTCARCHADAALMKPYGIPTDQVTKYRRSVHYEALTKRNDLSAPTCNDCHGSHGAAPPGVSSISNVCGTCHLQNMEFFQQSPHAEPFAEMGSGACEACHGNHEIKAPSDRLVGMGKGAVCAGCHDIDDPGGTTAAAIGASLELAVEMDDRAKAEVADAERKGMLMEDADVELEAANEELVKARIQVHKASLQAVVAHTSKAVSAAKKALEAAAAARREIRTRRAGLSVALALILIAIVALVLKIRQIER
ncbi:MAG: hypothetical protein GXP47_01540 [Acidobacteria bacterium]|nr:hypothetical protein [Acidobacteriota bacterium]